MNRQFLIIPGVLALGVFTALFYQEYLRDHQSLPAGDESQAGDQLSQPDTQAHTQDLSGTQDARRLALLEARVEKLQSRIELMEAGRSRLAGPGESEFSGSTAFPTDDSSLQVESLSMMDSLVFAGVDAASAEDITRRINESELKRLELRDKAIREEYIGTKRYREELRSMLADNTSVRAEVGDEFFDRYLYASGQANRVGIASVMAGSEAERAGIERGDQILSYGDQRMFGYNELRTATTQGLRGEYVEVRIIRSGIEVIVSIPRGPLGVRLTSVRVDPDNS
jgi:hypothetical protein